MARITFSPDFFWSPYDSQDVNLFFDLDKQNNIITDDVGFVSYVNYVEASVGNDFLEARSLVSRPTLFNLVNNTESNILAFSSFSSTYLTFSNGFDILDKAVVAVFVPSTANAGTIFSYSEDTNSYADLVRRSDSLLQYNADINNQYWDPSVLPTATLPTFSTSTLGFAGSSTPLQPLIYRTNGLAEPGGTSPTNSGYTFFNVLGASDRGGVFQNHLDGYVGPIVVLNNVQSEIEKVEGFFAKKFAFEPPALPQLSISLSPGHPYETSPPINADAESKVLTVSANNGVAVKGSGITGLVRFMYVNSNGFEVPILNEGQPVEYTGDFQDLLNLRYGSKLKILHEGRSQDASIEVNGINEWS